MEGNHVMTIPVSSLDAALDAVKETVVEHFAERGRWEPVAFISARRGPDGADNGMPTEIAIDLSKIVADSPRLIQTLAEIVRTMDAAQIIVALEAWMATRQSADQAERLARRGLKDEPGRSEVVALYLNRDDGTDLMWIAPIARVDGAAKLEGWDLVDSVAGPFAQLFPPRTKA